MSLSKDGDTIRLMGVCRVEDAEALTALLQGSSAATVDLTGCDGLHGSVVQAILAFRPAVIGPSNDPFLRDHLLPIFTRARNLATPEP